MGLSKSLVVVAVLVAALLAQQLDVVRAGDTSMIIRELRERRPPPFRPKSPLANQEPGMRRPAPPEEQPPPAGPPPPLPTSINNLI